MSLDLIPMLVLSLLLLTTGGGSVQTAEIVLGGQHEASAPRGALMVGDGEVTVPASAAITGPIHVLGGETRIRGTVEGDVTLFAGRLLVDEGAEIRGTLQHVGGSLEVDPRATIGRQTTIEIATDEPDPVRRFLPMVLVTGLLAFVGARRARRRPGSLEHMRNALAHHPVISLTVGGLMAVTFLSLFVFMAFTLILIPVSLLGLGAGLVMLAYGIVALGSLVAQRLPIRRPELATAAGVAAVMVGIQLIDAVPVLGNAAVGALLLASLGAVIVTYVGLQEFTPVTISEEADR
jgi:cytoskeletal protein CcmA (bactofilin family)